MMTGAKERLKMDIESIEDEATLEKIRIYIMGIQAQQNLERSRMPPEQKARSFICQKNRDSK